MLTSLGILIVAAWILSSLADKLGLPRILGYMVAGILLGPYAMQILDPKLLSISAELRRVALIIILLKAGLSLDLQELHKVGRPAFLLSFLPATFEILATVLFAPHLLGISLGEAALMGAVLGAVSPAVVVPRMVNLIENQYGTNRQIPQMLLAGASLDDIYTLVLFSAFLGLLQGQSMNWLTFLQIPLSMITGLCAGALLGFLLTSLFEILYKRGNPISNSGKIILLLGFSFLLVSLEDFLNGRFPFSGLLAVISMSLAIKNRGPAVVTASLTRKFSRIWMMAEILLFVLVGAAVDIRYTLHAGLPALILILLAQLWRAIGVQLALFGTRLNRSERIFSAIAYVPKATVQAAIGSVPLSMGLACGPLVLSVAVLAILITCPLGAIGMDRTYKTLLTHTSPQALSSSETDLTTDE